VAGGTTDQMGAPVPAEAGGPAGRPRLKLVAVLESTCHSRDMAFSASDPSAPQPPSLVPEDARFVLDEAARARRVAGRPQPTPSWYGPVVAVLLAVFGVSTDAGRAWHAPWVFLGVAVGYGVGVGVAYGRARAANPVMPRVGRLAVGMSLAVTVCCAGAAAVVFAAGSASHLPMRGTFAGGAAGAVFWIWALVGNWLVRRAGDGTMGLAG
jgi:hypothetical protein